MIRTIVQFHRSCIPTGTIQVFFIILNTAINLQIIGHIQLFHLEIDHSMVEERTEI